MASFYEISFQIMFAVLAFSLFSLIFWFYWSQWRILSVAWKLQTFMPSYPIIGHGYVIARGAEWAINYGLDSLKKYIISGSCPRSVFWLGPYPMFCVFDPEDIHAVLQHKKSFERGVEPKILKVILGNGLFTCSADVWKVTRHHINPMFHHRNTNLLFPIFNEIGRELTDNLAPHVGSGLCDAKLIVQPCFLKSTCKLLFGLETEVDTRSNMFLKSVEAIIRVSEIVLERFFIVFAWPDPVFNLLYSSEVKAKSILVDKFIAEAIESSRKQDLVIEMDDKHGTGLRVGSEDIQDKGETADRRIQITLEDAYKNIQKCLPGFTEVDLYNEVKTMFAAGTETSRVTLSSCILALAAHTQIQEKLYAEIVTVTGAEDCDVTPEHIRAMPYLDQVLKETLRRFITVPLFTSRTLEDLKLSKCSKDWTIPEGSLVAVFPLAIHYNPKLYPNPERFDPDRFSPENVEAVGNGFIAFGSGPRMCIGKVYSLMLIKTLVAHLVKKYRFSTTVDINSQTLCPRLAAGFKNGYNVEVEVR